MRLNTGREKRPEAPVDKEEETSEETPKKGLPWFLSGSIIVLVIVIGVAGYMAYKYWKRRRDEMQTSTDTAIVPAGPGDGIMTIHA
jgi:heme/copper-type cytochrome/quinol oxidase subunit 2